MSELVRLLSPEASRRQRDSVAVIEDEFIRAGFPLAMAAGASVNAYAESGLNPAARNGPMWGLFQLDANQGAGIGMSEAQLVDARANTRRIVHELKGSRGARIRAALDAGERHPHVLAGMFAVDIERPRDKWKAALHREGLTWVLYPGLVVPGRDPSQVVIGGSAVGGALSEGMTTHLSAAQRAMAALIESRFVAAGIPAEIIAGAIANAYAESRLNPAALADEPNGTQSAGLFQLNDHGAGRGMTIAERQDPAKNIAGILAEYRRGYGNALENAYQSGIRDIGQFAALWTVHLERPQNAEHEGVIRRALAYRLFPAWARFRPLLDVTPGEAAEGGAVVLLGLGLVGGLVLFGRRKRR